MLGTHLVADYAGVDYQKLNDEDFLKDVLQKACEKGNLTIISGLSYRFYPQGVTVLYLLSESHISIHTEPENQTAHIDVYHCGTKGNVYVTLNYIKDQLNPKETNVTILQR